MGTFKQRIEIAASPEGPFRGLYALVDTGSFYTWVPGRILSDLGLSPAEVIEFEMANGNKVMRGTAEALMRLDGRVVHTIFVFGEAGDATLLGAYALEGFALAVDPIKKRLVRLSPLPAMTSGSMQSLKAEY